MKKRNWIIYFVGVTAAWLLLSVGYGIERQATFPAPTWLLGFVERNAGFIIALLMGAYLYRWINGKED